MIKRPWSIHSRIAHAFLIVTLFVAAAHTGAFVYHWDRFDRLTRQVSNWEVPTHLAEQLRPLYELNLQGEALAKAFADFVFVHPGVEPYLINRDGKVLASRFRERELSMVDTQPILQFLKQEGFPGEVIYGTQPTGTHRKPTPFSVASVTIEGQPGYLYLVLETSDSRTVSNSIGDNAALRIAVLFFFSAVIGGSAIGLGLLFMLSRRFKHLTGIVQEFKQGDYSRRADIPSNDELGMYADTFNEMADQIVEQLDQLESTDRLRRELIAGVSHDLRAPLTRVRTNIEAARSELQTGEVAEATELLDRGLVACDGLSELLQDLFELSKLNADGFNAEAVEFSIDELIDSLIVRLSPLAREKGVSLELEAAENLPLAIGDQRLTSRAVFNVLENALTHTATGGSVTVTVIAKKSKLEISLSDTGVGIPAEELLNIFDRFFRASTSLSKAGGTGLGLAIAKRSIEVQGSDLEVESEVGIGTTFRFSLASA